MFAIPTQSGTHLVAIVTALTLSGAAQSAANHSKVEILVPGSVIQAIEGIDIGPDGMIYGTSIHAQAVYRIDPVSGGVTIAVRSPYGESDDVAVGPKGSPVEGVLAWTAQHTGEIRIQRPDGMPMVVLPDVARVNPIAFNAEGRLFTAQSGTGNESLWEIDVIGNQPPRLVAENQGRVNGFGFGPDGRLYAPHFGTDELFAIDVDSGTYTVIAKGVGSPAAAKADANGDVWSVDYITGDLWFTDMDSGESTLVTNFPPPLDNLAIAEDGTIYLASLADSGILGYNPKTQQRWIVTAGAFTVPLGLTMTTVDGNEMILAADPFGYRFIDPSSGEMTREPTTWSTGGSGAVAANDDFIVTTLSAFTNRIRKIDRKTHAVVATSTAIEAPRGVVITSTGDAIIADASGNRLVRLDGEDVVELVGGLQEPVALLLETDTLVLVTEIASGTVSRVDLESGRRTPLVSGLHSPRGLARLLDGRIAVVEPRGTVTAIDLDTGERTELATGLPVSLDHHDLPKNTPLGIAVGRDGAIYVSCGGDNSIVKIIVGST
jgi:sugar lactone lactonase YvrE